jgi:hypothetical protein
MPRGYLSGLVLSTAGGSASFGVAAGQAVDSTNVDVLNFPSAVTKTTGPWAVGSGNGALDTGAIAINTWYHVYLIKRPDTGVVDVLISLSATAPTLPSGYTLFRRIGAMRTDPSLHWTSFTQFGDEFLWATAVADVPNTAIGSVPTSYYLSVPPGVNVNALIQVYYTNSTGAFTVLIYALDRGAQATTVPSPNWTFSNPSTSVYTGAPINVRTNMSSQIGAIAAISAGNALYIYTYGWIDRRGRDA